MAVKQWEIELGVLSVEGCQCSSDFKHTAGGSVGFCVHKFLSLADVALECFLDELEAAPVEKRVLLLWFANVEVINIYMNKFPDARV